MLDMNFLAILVAALSSFVVGFVYYNPKVLGTAWMKSLGLTEEDLKGANMFVTFGLALVFAFMIAFIMQTIVIHQYGAYGMIGGNPEGVKPSFNAFMEDYGNAYRTFKHGALHGFIITLFLVFPVIATNGLFERKSWKYIFITSGYWFITNTIMGAIICGWV